MSKYGLYGVHLKIKMSMCNFIMLLIFGTTAYANDDNDRVDTAEDIINPPFKCLDVGRRPDPYDCRASYICEDIVHPKDGRCNTVPNECITATQRCICPPNTFWGGPSVECISNADEMKACCHESDIDCSNVYGLYTFGPKCPLTKEGYYYECIDGREDVGEVWLHVGKCENDTAYEPKGDRCLKRKPGTKISADEGTTKILPVCEPIKGKTQN